MDEMVEGGVEVIRAVLAFSNETHFYSLVQADTSRMCFIYSGSCLGNCATPTHSIVKQRRMLLFSVPLC